MALIQSSKKVVRFSSRTKWAARQVLYQEYRLFGVRVWRTKLDEEEVPAWALIEAGALGSTDWRSKFADVISAGAPR